MHPLLCNMDYFEPLAYVQDIFHQAPACESRLEEIQSHKCGEQIPIGVYPMSQRQTHQDKRTCNQANISFECHPEDLLLHLFSSLPAEGISWFPGLPDIESGNPLESVALG